jgi:uncharacterized protein (DUF1697 family)
MTAYVVLLRAVNVGVTGKLPMSNLKSMRNDLGFTRVETYIASDNIDIVFVSKASAAKVKSDLEARLLDYAGKKVGVLVHTAAEMKGVRERNPFPKAAPNYTSAIFLDGPPPRDALEAAVGVSDEEIGLGTREICVHYPSGMAARR